MIKIIISGGGTGGHIYPAIAIADAIREIAPDAEILFIGALGKMEMQKVPAAGYPIKGLPVTGFQRSLTLKNLGFPFRVLISLRKASAIIREFKPDLVLGVGGYASGPTLRVASGKKIPTLIQEQNSLPGVTNRLLAKRVTRICVAYEGMERFFPGEKIVLTGNPVRKDLTNLDGKRSEALSFFGLDPAKQTLLVIGGSLGARTINNSISQCIRQEITASGLQVLWQTGKYYYEDILSGQKELLNPDVHIHGFIDRMDLAFACADMVVSRAGALAISELCIAGKPAILVPSPNVTEDHQTKNAMALVEKNAAILVKDAEAEITLNGEITKLANAPLRKKELSQNIRRLARTDAAHRIAEEALKLIKNQTV